RAGVVEAMLAEVRRLFSNTRGADTGPVHELIDRVLLVQSSSLEAFFWQGLCFVREGEIERAMAALQRARTGEGGVSPTDEIPVAEPVGVPASAGQAEAAGASASAVGRLKEELHPSPKANFLDPSLYLGALLLRQGQPKEALRFLTEANRLDGNCPIVTWQLRTAGAGAGAGAHRAPRAVQ